MGSIRGLPDHGPGYLTYYYPINEPRNVHEKPSTTVEYLSELDNHRITNNAKLRHDVTFDRELHFRPDLDGPYGRQRPVQTWKALKEKLMKHNKGMARYRMTPPFEDRPYIKLRGRSCIVRLRRMFAAIEDIFITLVPDDDWKAVRDQFNVERLMQPIRQGRLGFGLSSLANWSARLLKKHCAPTRDQLVNTMRESIETAVLNNDCKELADGLRQLMDILEHMKLDVAGHEARLMRPLLIEETVESIAYDQSSQARPRIAKITIGLPRRYKAFSLPRPTTDFRAFRPSFTLPPLLPCFFFEVPLTKGNLVKEEELCTD